MLYLQMMTPSEIQSQYPTYKVVKYNKILQKFEQITAIPSIGVYQVIKGIHELELLD